MTRRREPTPTPATAPARFAPPRSPEAKLRQRYPTVAYLREHARKRCPRFGFEAIDGGAGADLGIVRNAAALDAIEILPRCGVDVDTCSLEVELFGQQYAAPIAMAPMGMIGIVYPGAEKFMARAACAARIPYIASTPASLRVEELAEYAQDMLWFQLYRLATNDHEAGFDLARRAQVAGARVLMMSLDTPSRTKRPRELRQGLVLPLRMQMRTIWDVLTSPAWLLAYLRHGLPRFGNYHRYVTPPTSENVQRFAQLQTGGAFTWEEVKRYRELWKGPLVLKGILHHEDAAKAVCLGADGVVVSNHGGRQIEGLVASIDMLPAIVSEVGDRATVFMDSGIRSGLDVARALALGAKSTLVGKAFLYGLGAVGGRGPAYVVRTLIEELSDTLRQAGVASVKDARSIEVRHERAWPSKADHHA